MEQSPQKNWKRIRSRQKSGRKPHNVDTHICLWVEQEVIQFLHPLALFSLKQRMKSSVESEEEVEQELEESDRGLKQLLWAVEEKTDLKQV